MSKRRLLVLVAVAGAALAGLAGAGLTGLWWLNGSLGASPRWVTVSAPPPQFQVKTAAKTLYLRESGFQDPRWELLFEVADVERFLEANGLRRGEAAAPAVSDAPVRAERATELEGGDGQLWEAGGRTFVYLVAVGG
jgi:hypothetical protein